MQPDLKDESLVRKLGIRNGSRITIIDAPQNYWAMLGEELDNVTLCRLKECPVDFMHIFIKEKAVLQGMIMSLKDLISSDGMIWVSWPKKSSKIKTDVDENIIRELALQAGLVDIKVCAIDETWSGLKLVIPVKKRK